MLKKLTCGLLAIVAIFGLSSGKARAEGENFCQTWEIYQQGQLAKKGAMYEQCDNGICDDPANRDAAIPDSTDPIKYVRLYFNIFCEDDGSNCATTETTLANQVNELNADYLPLRIQFVYDYRFVNSSQYRHSPNAYGMKLDYAVSPGSYLNVYITDYGGGSFGTFPWDDVRLPLSFEGGVVLTESHVYPAPYHDNVLTHEIGHTLGLWHTHHGVSEVTYCGECYERADGLNADITGDLCSETPPTPTNTFCQDPGGTDGCSGTPWGATDYHNFMSYAPLNGGNCWDHFTPQQWGRIQCWTDDVLSCWFTDSPEVTSVYPVHNALDVGMSSVIFVTFNTEMDAASINNSTFKVTGNMTGDYSGAITYYPGSFVAFFDPDKSLAMGEEITVVLTEDILTTCGSSLVNGYTWSFVIEDCASGEFDPSLEYSVYANPNNATAADFDGDGLVDIATCSQTRNYVSVLLNDGQGGFPSHNDIYLGSNHGPNGICAADFTGDGHIDLATINYVSDNVTILVNNGSGGFNIQGEYAVVDIHGGCYPADMDGDGHIDLVVGIGSGSPDYIAVFYNNGNGTFSKLTRLEVLDNPFDPKAADLNNDGALDLVIVNAWSDSVSVYLNDGAGGFGTRSDYFTGDRPLEVIVIDLNNDGYNDLAVCNKTDNNVSIFVNDSSGGFGPRNTYGPLYGPEAITTADFNGDGAMDLATVNRDDMSVTVLWNNGSAVFTIEQLDDFCDTQMYCSGVDIVAADLDGEGSVDLFTVNIDDSGTISVMKNFGKPDAPQLYSPVNGKTLTAPATPRLNCYDVFSAIYYNFEIDDDPNFGSPIASPLFLTESEWTVDTPLGVGTYYWRARAANMCGFGPWSVVWHIVVRRGPTPSCPVLFSFNGYAFVEENPLLTACEHSGYTEVVTDYYQLIHPLVPQNGRVIFQLREMEDEITYLNNVELITVDHSLSTGIGCTVDGKIFTYNTWAEPLSAIDQDGVDQLEAVRSSDNVMFTSEGSGYLILTFPGTGSESGISFGAPKKPPCIHEEEPEGPKVIPHQYTATELTIEQKTDDGNWIKLSDVPTRTNSTSEFVMSDILAGSESDVITIRISWPDQFETDEIRQYVPSDEIANVKTWTVNDYQLMAGNANAWAGFKGSVPLRLKKGEFIEFSFDTDEQTDQSMTRDYIIRAVGRYQPDYSVYTHLMPNNFRLYNNYPNPFNPVTEIRFDLPLASNVTIEVFNIAGQKTATVVNGYFEAGKHTVIWDATNASSGVYFYRLKAGEFVDSKKMTLIK